MTVIFGEAKVEFVEKLEIIPWVGDGDFLLFMEKDNDFWIDERRIVEYDDMLMRFYKITVGSENGLRIL